MYATKFECPGCSEQLSANARKCSCGWIKSDNATNHDPRCSFILNGERCCLPGTHSNSTHKSNDWRCSYHHAVIGNNFESAKWMTFIKNNLQEIIHFRKHYSSNFQNCARCLKLCDAEDIFGGRPPRSSFRENPKKLTNRRDHLELSDEARKLRDELDEKQQESMRKMLNSIPNSDFSNNENKDLEDVIF